jgi:uncharacterized pyridoxamine 5'-phosphate oxidase family protein
MTQQLFETKIIEDNEFMALATCVNDDPWITPLFYCTDCDYNLYFVSSTESLHARHISNNKNVAICIFDVNHIEGGVKIKGEAVKCKESEYPSIIRLLFMKKEKINILSAEIEYKILQYKNDGQAIYKVKPNDILIFNERAD